MTKRHKPNTSEERDNEGAKTPLSVRFGEAEVAELQRYEKLGLNMSDIIRRCVKKSLPDVVEEIASEIQRLRAKS